MHFRNFLSAEDKGTAIISQRRNPAREGKAQISLQLPQGLFISVVSTAGNRTGPPDLSQTPVCPPDLHASAGAHIPFGSRQPLRTQILRPQNPCIIVQHLPDPQTCRVPSNPRNLGTCWCLRPLNSPTLAPPLGLRLRDDVAFSGRSSPDLMALLTHHRFVFLFPTGLLAPEDEGPVASCSVLDVHPRQGVRSVALEYMG